MDLKAYYRKLREVETSLAEEFVVVKSRATADGGVAGRLTEVTREVAARMLAEGAAEVAAKAEAATFRERLAEEKAREDQKRAAQRIQFAVLTEADLKALQEPRGRARQE